jgi:mRNA interferase MazF
MSIYARGDVVVLPFPFTDLSQAKKRPALVLWNSTQDDFICCAITSRRPHYPAADLVVPLEPHDFAFGELPVPSHILTWKVFTVHQTLVQRVAGRVQQEIVDRVATCLCDAIGAD